MYAFNKKVLRFLFCAHQAIDHYRSSSPAFVKPQARRTQSIYSTYFFCFDFKTRASYTQESLYCSEPFPRSIARCNGRDCSWLTGIVLQGVHYEVNKGFQSILFFNLLLSAARKDTKNVKNMHHQAKESNIISLVCWYYVHVTDTTWTEESEQIHWFCSKT